MRVPHVRLTVRWMMVAVALIAVSSWLAATVFRVKQEPVSRTYHVIVPRDPENPTLHDYLVYQCPTPFMPRYWRRLFGQSWPVSYTCRNCKSPLFEDYRIFASRTGPVLARGGMGEVALWVIGRFRNPTASDAFRLRRGVTP